MNIAEQIKAFRVKREQAEARQREIIAKAAEEDRTLDEDEASEHDSLDTEIEHIDAHIKRLEKHEQDDAKTARPVETRAKTSSKIIVKKTDAEDKFEGQSFTRRVIAKALAHVEGYERPAWQIAEQRWGKTNPQLVEVMKVGVAGGGSGTGEWGAELVDADNRYTGDFIEYLANQTVFDRLPLREVPANVTIKGQDGIATGYWVGESASIPASAQDFSSVSLTPLKVAAISVVSNELLRDSSPSAEMLVRDGLVQASAQRIDSTFLSTSSESSGVSPAGILNGLTPGLGSNGYTADALRMDVKELYAPFIQANNADGLYYVMSPSLAKAIQLLYNALGQPEFSSINANGGSLLGDPVVTGNNVNATHMILLKPSDIYKIGDMGVQVSISRDATIEQDSSPTGDSENPTAASATLMSMFGTESTALKVVRSINFAKRRSSAVQYIGDAQYGDSSSTTD